MPHRTAIGTDRTAWKGTVAALLAILVGIGLSRLAYSPLIPALVDANWFTASEAAYLGAANLAGYLLGALGGRRLATWLSTAIALRLLMLVAGLAFLACAVPVSFLWYFLWRLLSGIAGGGLMVLAAPTVLPHIDAGRRGRAAGTIFAGVGVGIVLSGTLVPVLLVEGLPTTWLALAALCFAATALAWRWWPAAPRATQPVGDVSVDRLALRHPTLLAIYASYGLIAVGLVPHMVFLVDFAVRGLGQGMALGGRYWVLFGVGALVGPVLAGRLADRFGYTAALRGVLVLHIAGTALLAFDHSVAAFTLSSVIVGSAVSGTVPLVLGQTQERSPSPETQKAAWSVATAIFALGQAAGGYAYSYLYAVADGAVPPLFLLGAAALLLALLTNLAATPMAPAPRRGSAAATTVQPVHPPRHGDPS